MKKILLSLLMLACILPYNVFAYCEYQKKSELNKLAYNVNYTYEAVYKDDYYYFNVRLLNVNKNLYILDENKKKVYHYNENNIIDVGTYVAGSKLVFKVYSTNQVADCNDLSLSTIYINLPNYNMFYRDELCSGIQDYSLCQKWVNANITRDWFEQSIKEYIDKTPPKEDDKKVEEGETLIGRIIDFIVVYHRVILAVIVISGVSGIIAIKTIENKTNRYKI